MPSVGVGWHLEQLEQVIKGGDRIHRADRRRGGDGGGAHAGGAAARAAAEAKRDRAVVAEAKATAERENAKQAAGFFWEEVGSLTSPYREADRGLKLQTAVDRMEARLVAGEAGLPGLVEASVRRRLGDLLQAGYQDGRAKVHFR